MLRELLLVFHLASLLVVFLSLGGIITHIWQGGTKESLKPRLTLMNYHGLALLVVIITGLGLVHAGRFSFSSDAWIYIKLAAWLALGAFPVVIFKKRIPAKWGVPAVALVGALAIYAALFKPGM